MNSTQRSHTHTRTDLRQKTSAGRSRRNLWEQNIRLESNKSKWKIKHSLRLLCPSGEDLKAFVLEPRSHCSDLRVNITLTCYNKFSATKAISNKSASTGRKQEPPWHEARSARRVVPVRRIYEKSLSSSERDESSLSPSEGKIPFVSKCISARIFRYRVTIKAGASRRCARIYPFI